MACARCHPLKATWREEAQQKRVRWPARAPVVVAAAVAVVAVAIAEAVLPHPPPQPPSPHPGRLVGGRRSPPPVAGDVPFRWRNYSTWGGRHRHRRHPPAHCITRRQPVAVVEAVPRPVMARQAFRWAYCREVEAAAAMGGSTRTKSVAASKNGVGRRVER